MMEYRYDEMKIGMEAAFCTTITKEKMQMFAQITGDYNPLHSEYKFAADRGHQNVVVYGMLTAAFYSTLAGMYIPGKYSLIHSVDSKFLLPVYPGDKLEIKGQITEKNDTFKLLTIKAVITNQAHKKVSKAIIKVGVTDE